MKQIFLSICLLINTALYAQTAKPAEIYHVDADAESDVAAAVKKANTEGKHVMLMLGGNWCKWCRMFYKFCNTTPSIDSLLKADYVVVHINYSKENKNPELLKKLEYPQRFGFPVFVVLDEKGNRLHTQNSGYLEEGEGYSEKKVLEFLKHWNSSALSDENY